MVAKAPVDSVTPNQRRQLILLGIIEHHRTFIEQDGYRLRTNGRPSNSQLADFIREYRVFRSGPRGRKTVGRARMRMRTWWRTNGGASRDGYWAERFAKHLHTTGGGPYGKEEVSGASKVIWLLDPAADWVMFDKFTKAALRKHTAPNFYDDILKDRHLRDWCDIVRQLLARNGLDGLLASRFLDKYLMILGARSTDPRRFREFRQRAREHLWLCDRMNWLPALACFDDVMTTLGRNKSPYLLKRGQRPPATPPAGSRLPASSLSVLHVKLLRKV